MTKKSPILNLIILVVIISFTTTGCTLIFQKGRRSDYQKISELKGKISDLERARGQLENRLKDEIDDKEVKIEMLERGLVITFVAEVLFNSGKAKLRPDSHAKLDKVASVVNTTVSDLNIGIEGHTDSVPIKYSGWKSNWELSSARAMSVLHYLIDNHNVSPSRLAATGYGEHQPIADNSTKTGREKNRRVEIVILPKTNKELSEEAGNLK